MKVRKLRREIAHRVHSTRPVEFALIHRWLALKRGEWVCDVGCGDGFWTSQLAGGGRRIWGIDVDPGAVDRAKAYYGKAATFLVGRGDALPFASGTIDAVSAVCALQHFPDDVQGLREFGRVLRPGGRLAMSLDSLSLPCIEDSYKALQARCYGVAHLYTQPSIRLLLQEAGFALRRHAYVGTSRVACRLIQLQVRRGWQVNYLAPLAVPLAKLTDVLAGQVGGGYSLVVLAEKGSG